tara:strand:+ start:1280 stop:1774 length:495 start_codon:yes stop_codon:yes gene_type:complete
MTEYRNRKTGEVKTKEELRKEFASMSLPPIWGQNVFDAMNIDPILPSPPATTSTYQVSVRDGVEQDSKGNWIEKYIAKDMFEATSEKTKEELEKEYQKKLDDAKAANVRAERNLLLKESDWTMITDSPLSDSKKTEWKTYRQKLRDIPASSGFPNSITFPDKPE